ncbi:hypothetical protein AB0L71_27400 [Streptomyces sp. NPDC052052]|uniref:hypothetical protein n=1 Tax=Streptomyces sp. NPDC052052 TaxID=3154756 RepID=UPI003412F948
MGLMSWLRGGGRTETGPGAGAQSAAAAVPPEAARGERVDLAELPPLQRMLGAGPELVSDPSGFQGALTTRQDPALGTPLGHLVSPDAPTGLVHGITTPAPADRTSPVQRSAERAAELPVRGWSTALPTPTTWPVPVQRAVGAGTPVMTSADGSDAVAELPVRRLVGEQSFVPASVPQPQPQPQPEPADPAPAPPSASVPGPASAPLQRAVAPSAAEPALRRPGLGAPLSALPPTAQRQAAPGPDSAPAPVQRAVTDMAAGTEPVDRGTQDGSADLSSGAPETAARRETPMVPEPAPAEEVSTAPLLGDDPLLPASSLPAPSGPPPPLPQPSTPSSGPAVQRTPDRPVPASVPASVPPPSPTAPVAPLLGDRPLTLHSTESRGTDAVAGVQRSAAEQASASVQVSASTPWSAPVSEPDAVPLRWVPAGAYTPSVPVAPSGPAAVQRTAAPAGEGPGMRPPPPSALQRQAVGGPPVPRSFSGSGSRDVPSTPSVTSMPSASSAGPAAPSSPATASSYVTAGSAAVAAGVAQRMADGSVVFGSPPPAYSAPVVQREEQTAEAPPPDPSQEPGAEPEPEPGPTAEDHGSTAPAPGGPPGQGGGPGGGGAPVVTDELVRALYAPLSRLFKADLRLERERAGLLINTRH